MKQLFQDLSSGSTNLIDCPYPHCRKGSVLIQSKVSLVSLGTEKMLVDFGKSNLIQKAKQQPEKVRQVIDKIKTDGAIATLNAVRGRLDEPLPLGYCNAGIVVETGGTDTGFSIGDRVVSNGPHAEIVSVSKNLVAAIPDGLPFEQAAFTVVGAIGLQGIRLAAPTLGETAVVIGLGLIGQLTAQLALANGCRVIAFDLDGKKTALAAEAGVEAHISDDPVATVLDATHGVGADCVIITASSTAESIISRAARMSRKHGRIVLVGVVPLPISRSEFYEKELTFRVSCSYGPGRYDPFYESEGNDYPLPYVRWTEKRNFEAVLHCMKAGSISVERLITERIPFEQAPEFYTDMGNGQSIASLLIYPELKSGTPVTMVRTAQGACSGTPAGNWAIIGAGNFTKMTLLPALKRLSAPVQIIGSQTGTTGPYLARKFGIPACTTNTSSILDNDGISVIFITTRHASHTALSLNALDKGKHVFVEKPLAVNREDLRRVADFVANMKSELSLTVGFNRRYSPLVADVKRALGSPPSRLNMIFTMNAGALPQNHWLKNAGEGGRIIGEACHCIDLFVYLAASPIVSVCAAAMDDGQGGMSDNVSLLLMSAGGSQATVHYFANGNKRYVKEKITIFSNSTVYEIDNFRALKICGVSNRSRRLATIDKGHFAQFQAYHAFLQGKGVLKNTMQEHLNVTEASIAAVESLVQKKWIDLEYTW